MNARHPISRRVLLKPSTRNSSMSEHVTISLDAEQLERARREAGLFGVNLEAYLSRLVQGGLPTAAPVARDKPHNSAIFGIGASAAASSARDRNLGSGSIAATSLTAGG